MKVKSINNFIAKATAVATVSMLYAGSALATAPTSLNEGITDAKPTGASENLFGPGSSIFNSIANTLIYIVGAISVIMLIIGGLRYVLSSGNSSAVEGAKNTILYAIIGIVVASLAFAAVRFVGTQLAK